MRGYRDGENPGRWRGHLDHLLPKRSKVRAIEHHAALPYEEMGEFMSVLRTRDGVAARALEFAILTAAGTGEVLGARWDEIDLANKVWAIPASRMKSHREHRAPLSKPALAILKAMKGDDGREVHVPERSGRRLAIWYCSCFCAAWAIAILQRTGFVQHFAIGLETRPHFSVRLLRLR